MPDHKLEITSDGGKVEYELRTTGKITPVNAEDHEELENNRVKGHVNGGTDVFEYDGAAMNFAVHQGFEHLTLKRDDEPANPSHLKMHIAVVKPVNGSASFGLSSSGKMIRRGKAEANDVRVSETEFEGSVGEPYTDKFAFQGTLTGLWCNSKCEWTIDGETKTVEGTPPSGSW